MEIIILNGTHQDLSEQHRDNYKENIEFDILDKTTGKHRTTI